MTAWLRPQKETSLDLVQHGSHTWKSFPSASFWLKKEFSLNFLIVFPWCQIWSYPAHWAQFQTHKSKRMKQVIYASPDILMQFDALGFGWMVFGAVINRSPKRNFSTITPLVFLQIFFTETLIFSLSNSQTSTHTNAWIQLCNFVCNSPPPVFSSFIFLHHSFISPLTFQLSLFSLNQMVLLCMQPRFHFAGFAASLPYFQWVSFLCCVHLYIFT